MTRPFHRLLALSAVLSLLVLTASLPVLAQSGEATGIAHRQSVRAEMDPNGDINSARVFTQLAVQGSGQVEVALPDQATGSLRNLDGFGRPQIDSGQVTHTIEATPDGAHARTVATHRDDLPIELSVIYRLDGQEIAPRDLVGRSGDLEVSFTARNTTSTPVEVEYRDGRNVRQQETIDVSVPFVGSISMDLDERFVDVSAPGASVAGNGRGDTFVSWSLVLFSPVGSEEQTVSYTAHVSDAIVPGVVAQFLPVDSNSFRSLASVQETFGGVADGLRELTGGAMQIDSNLTALAIGSGQLLTGVGRLSRGADQLAEGLNETAVPGAAQLADGTGAARDGSQQLADGALRAMAGGRDLADGTGTAAAGSRDLADGAAAAAAGGRELAEGTGTAAAGSRDLRDGSLAAAAGGSDLADGLVQLNAGAGELSAGLGAARAGSEELSGGLGQLADGAGELSTGLAAARAGGAELAAGLGGAAAPGAAALAAGLSNEAAPGAAELEAGLTALLAAFGTSDDSPTAGTVLGGLAKLLDGLQEELAPGTGAMRGLSAGLAASFGPDAAGNDAGARAAIAAAGAAQIRDSADGLSTTVLGIDGLLQGVETDPDGDLSPAQIEGLARARGGLSNPACSLENPQDPSNPCGVAQVLVLVSGGGEGLRAGLQDQADSLGSWPASCDAAVAAVQDPSPTGLEVIRALSCISIQVDDGLNTKIIPGVQLLQGGLDNPSCDLANPTDPANPCGVKQVLTLLRAGAGELSTGLAAAAEGAEELATGLDAAATGSAELSQGLAQLDEGGQQLAAGAGLASSGAQELRAGLGQLDAGGQQLAAGSSAAAAGSQELSTGLGRLDAGANQLAGGLGQLDAGANRLAGGLGELSAGANQLSGGLGQIDDGANQLADGLGELGAGTGDLAVGLGQIDDGANQLAGGLGDAGDGATQVAEGLNTVEDGMTGVAEGSQRLVDEGTQVLIESASDATATPALAVEQAMLADARGQAGEGLPYGTVDGAVASAVYQYELAAMMGSQDGPSLPVQGALAIIALGLAGGLTMLVRGRMV